MYNPFFSQTLSLVISVGGNLSLVWIFLRAMIWPLEYAEFIENTGALIFLIEFLSLHSNAFAMGLANQEKSPEERDPRIVVYSSLKGVSNINPSQKKFLLLGVYTIAVGGVGLATNNWFLPLIFFVGLISKFFGQKASHTSNPARFALSAVLLVFLTILIAPLSPFLSVFSFFSSSTGFASYPDAWVMLWGTLYYFILAAVEVAFFLRKESAIIWKPFYYVLIGLLRILTFFLRRHPQTAKLGGTIGYLQRAEEAGFDEFLKSVSAQEVWLKEPN